MKLKKSRLILIILGFLFLGIFLYFKISPFGYWSCQANLKQANHLFLGRGCFSRPTPAERYLKEDVLKMIADPLYFSLYSPRNFDTLKINLIFKPNLSLNTPVIEAGLLVDKDWWRYQLKPVYNYWLEEESGWLEINKEDEDIEALLKDNCGDLAINLCLAQYNLSSEQRQLLPDLSFINFDREFKELKVDFPLRGYHSFYIYLKNSDLDLSLTAKDLNYNQTDSPINIDIYTNDRLIFNKTWEDDRIEAVGSRQISDLFSLQLNLSSLPTGLYRIDLNVNDDIVFKEIKVNSSILAWRHRLWFYSSQTENINLFTDAKALQVKVLEPAAYQTLNFGQKQLALLELYSQTEIIQTDDSLTAIYPISLERGGILLESPGVFAFKEDLLFNPDYDRLDRFYNQQAKFILVNYQPVKKRLDGYYLAELEFDLRGVYREKNNYNFILSIPGLRVEDESEYSVEIKAIKAEFFGKSLIEKINEKIFKK